MNRTAIIDLLYTAADTLADEEGREFELVRTADPSGVSGVGVVADGIQFMDGVILHWHPPHESIAVWISLEEVLATHGHGGLTVARFTDGQEVA